MSGLPQILVGRFFDSHSCIEGEIRARKEWLEASGVPCTSRVCVCVFVIPEMCDAKSNVQELSIPDPLITHQLPVHP